MGQHEKENNLYIPVDTPYKDIFVTSRTSY